MVTTGIVIDNGIVGGGQLYQRLIEESYKVPAFGTGNTSSLSGHAEWGDPDLIKQGIHFARRNLVAVGILGSIALFLVDSPRVRDVTLRSGSYHDKARTLQVLARGFRHYYEFFQDENLLDPNSKGHQFVTKVRQRHVRMSKQSITLGGGRNPLPTTVPTPPLSTKVKKLLAAMRHDTSGIQEPQHVTKILLDKQGGSTQFDLMTGHFAFSSLLALFPAKLGVADDPKGLAAFLHLWAVIGSIMGVQDRYNVALHANDTASQKRILNDVTLASIKYMDEEVMSIPATICNVSSTHCPINGLMYFILQGIFGLDVPEVEKTLTWFDRFAFQVISGILRIMRASSLVRLFVNGILNTLTPILLKLFLLLYGETHEKIQDEVTLALINLYSTQFPQESHNDFFAWMLDLDN